MALDFLKRASKSPSSSKESEDGFDRAAYERRRQQVRRAQRNHRERKANYVKALEHEVSNLRKQNQHNIRELESEVQTLQTILLSLGQQPPPRQARLINPTAFDPNHPSSYTVSKPAGLGHALRLEVPEIDFSSSATPTALTVPGAAPSDAEVNFASTPVGNEQSLPQMIDKVHGINFVLSLEHACMGHPEVTRDGFGTHSHMVSHNLLSHAPQDVDAATAWEIPGANIEKLLALSNTFQLLGEITPVQGWYKLKEHPGFMGMNQRQLEQLSRLLARDAKCYGFGAVVEEQIWSLAVEEVLSQQSP